MNGETNKERQQATKDIFLAASKRDWDEKVDDCNFDGENNNDDYGFPINEAIGRKLDLTLLVILINFQKQITNHPGKPDDLGCDASSSRCKQGIMHMSGQDFLLHSRLSI